MFLKNALNAIKGFFKLKHEEEYNKYIHNTPKPVVEVNEPQVEENEETVYAKIKEAFTESTRTGKPVTLEFTSTRSIAKKLMVDFPFMNLGLNKGLEYELRTELEEENKEKDNSLTAQLKENLRKQDILLKSLSLETRANKYDYVAIDFETANSEKTSACSVAIVAVKDDEIVEEKHWYIRPDPLIISSFNEKIHGIGYDQLKNAPQFREVWSELSEFITNQTVIAHNMLFDKSVLVETLEYYAITPPKFTAICTLELARRTWKLEDYKLLTVAKFSGFANLIHHNALSDAKACAKIYSELLKEDTTTQSVGHIIDKGTSNRGKRNNRFGKQYVGYNKNIQNVTKSLDANIDPNHPFFEKRIIITGELLSMTREDAKLAILNTGGRYMTTVSKLTDYIVDGNQREELGSDLRWFKKTAHFFA